jgi:arsenate reductase
MTGVTDLILWTNPACSKSLGAQALAPQATLRRYLDEPPTRAELEDLLVKLGTDDPRAIARPGVLPGADSAALLDALSADPSLIERPIAIRGDRAVVARPPERLLPLLD